jgi:hypothetical protein
MAALPPEGPAEAGRIAARMGLWLETFNNQTAQGNALFKALGHPIAAKRVPALLKRLRRGGPVAVFDPYDQFDSFAAYYDLAGIELSARYVQRAEDLTHHRGTLPALPVGALRQAGCRTLLVAAFDHERALQSCQPFLADDVAIESFDALRLPARLISNRRRYLDPLNFATNFCLFRDAEGRHSELHTVEYWSNYGAKRPGLFLCLFGADGSELARWEERPAPGAGVKLDAREIRRRFDLPEFTGSLFMHAFAIGGHDVIKYILDDRDAAGRSPVVTHDANSWPADYYAGLPAPVNGDTVTLWLQNCHPMPIPAGAISLNRMGGSDRRPVATAIPPFGTHRQDVRALFPELEWPDQLEVEAGRYIVRPRYEIRRTNGTTALAHANVERTDLKPDPDIARLGNLFGKGFLLPAPILPRAHWHTTVLPTPMATTQRELPLAALVYDTEGHEVLRHPLGALPRDHRVALDVDRLLAEGGVALEHGHLELVYDFEAGQEADGWLHAIFRYEHRVSGQLADTSFGAHIFNTAMVFKGEPQSYHGTPPGLTTKLLLRLAPAPLEAFCVLIYPASQPWRPRSSTRLELRDHTGAAIAERTIEIACSGSHLVEPAKLFAPAELVAAGDDGHVIVRDRTCRLFGYHALKGPGGAFCLDHMFGF